MVQSRKSVSVLRCFGVSERCFGMDGSVSEPGWFSLGVSDSASKLCFGVSERCFGMDGPVSEWMVLLAVFRSKVFRKY